MDRRHDLDAVRAFAMLLGIALHAGLAFATIPWIVQDSRQSAGFSVLFQAIHGFRMPLFFIVSGFFTMMLWRRRGLRGLLRQRLTRIALPLALGAMTIIPATQFISYWAITDAIRNPAAKADDGTLVSAVRQGNHAVIAERLATTPDLNAFDKGFGVTPLDWAVLRGDAETVRLLLDHGADVNARNRDGNTPLHGAVFLGRVEIARLLMERGADLQAKSPAGEKPVAAARADWGITQYLASLLEVPLAPRDEVERARQEIVGLITAAAGTAEGPAEGPEKDRLSALRDAYQAAVTSPRLAVGSGDASFHLIQTPVFAHLWFLWFLCWLVALFALVAPVLQRLGVPSLPRGLVLSPANGLWLVPLTLIPQYLMGLEGPTIGPDSSTGIVPLPHLLLYYGVFYGFGALYYDAHDREGRLGRRWWLLLPVALFLVFPLALVTLWFWPLNAVLQVLYTWMMSFGVLGLFRRTIRWENTTVRYFSDASYWLYLTHLPLVLAAQLLVRDWPLPALLKFCLIVVGVTGLLLVIYQTMVRYTWLGTLLNGHRTRPERLAVPAATAVGMESS